MLRDGSDELFKCYLSERKVASAFGDNLRHWTRKQRAASCQGRGRVGLPNV